MTSIHLAYLITTILSLCSFGFGAPLEDYNNIFDESTRWELHEICQNTQYKIHWIKLQSLKWRNDNEVDQPIWTHWLTIIQPSDVEFDSALLFVEGGNQDSLQPSPSQLKKLVDAAVSTHSIICQLRMIPAQPLKFHDEMDPRYIEEGRKEDALLAYSWDKFLTTREPEWIIRLPMTKAIAKAMDAIQEYGSLHLDIPVNSFILTGASKRGWACWTAAAIDSRVKALIPLVIAPFHIKESFTRHWMAYGEWSPAIRDYLAIDLPSKWTSEAFKELMQIEEMNNYLDRLMMPKYLINATGDEFFLPDGSQHYFPGLMGPKHLRNVPNMDHKIDQSDAMQSILAYYQTILRGQPLPSVNWTKREDGTLEVFTSQKPLQATLWQASNPVGRDFRVSTIGKTWTSAPLSANAEGVYQVALEEPEEGWRAYFVELTFDTDHHIPLKITTDVFVVPDVFPFTAPQ